MDLPGFIALFIMMAVLGAVATDSIKARRLQNKIDREAQNFGFASEYEYRRYKRRGDRRV